MKPARFDLYALGARISLTRVMSRELTHWSDADEQVLGLVFQDTTDWDYGWILMARDRLGRFRCVDIGASVSSERVATERVRCKLSVTAALCV